MSLMGNLYQAIESAFTGLFILAMSACVLHVTAVAVEVVGEHLLADVIPYDCPHMDHHELMCVSAPW